MGRGLPIAAGLLLVGCAEGGTAMTSTTAMVGGESSGDVGSSSSAGATGEATGESSTSLADAETSSSGDDGTSGETGIADPCMGQLETFAVDPGWTPSGLPDGANVYGWISGSSHAGGDPGEIGGTFQRSGALNSFFDGVAPAGAEACINASGRLAIRNIEGNYNTSVLFGHFSTSGGGVVGMSIAEHDGATVRVFMRAGGFDELAFIVDASDVSREWSYAYDPTAATMTLAVEGYGSLSRPITAEQAMGIAALDAFGVLHTPNDSPGDSQGTIEMYFDEISYTR